MVLGKTTPSPKVFVDLISLCFKILFAMVFLTNLVWAIIYFKPQGSRVEINQSGAHDTVHSISAE